MRFDFFLFFGICVAVRNYCIGEPLNLYVLIPTSGSYRTEIKVLTYLLYLCSRPAAFFAAAIIRIMMMLAVASRQ